MSSSKKKEALNEENKVVAVLIAENFNNNFHPITCNIPLALLPLVNSPLIDYSLEWLQRNEVDETIVYCNSQNFSDDIRDHCRKWSTRYGNLMKVTVISSDSCTSLGDAMRDLYSKSLLKKDFILLTGLVIGNLDLKEVLKEHKSCIEKDPDCIMTCIYRQADSKDAYLDQTRTVDLACCSVTKKMVIHKRPEQSTSLGIPKAMTEIYGQLDIHFDIQDPHLAICSEKIPLLFSDNFDYGSRDSLINGVLEQEELLGCSIRMHLAEEGYASVVSSFKAYEDVSSALISRRIFPLVPERSLSSQRIRYDLDSLRNRYWDFSVKFHRNIQGDNVVIDAGTEIDPRCKIRDTVVGQHCVIKENVTINNSFLMCNVTVSKGCILDNCFIGSNSKLLPGVHLEPGVVLGPNTVLGPNLKVDRSKKLVENPPEGGSDEVCPLVCGMEGRAFEYPCNEKSSKHDVMWGEKWEKKEDTDTEDESDGDEVEDDEDEVDTKFSAGGDDDVSSDEEREQEFEKEVKDSLLNAFRNDTLLDNVILEVNSSRHAYNVSMENVLATVTKAVLTVGEISGGSRLTGETLWQSMKKGLVTFGKLIKNYIRKMKDQMVVLKVIEDMVGEEERFLAVTRRLLYEMNQVFEILDDEVIIFWYTNQGHKTNAFPLIANSIVNFVEWLKENEMESGSEEDDD